MTRLRHTFAATIALVATLSGCSAVKERNTDSYETAQAAVAQRQAQARSFVLEAESRRISAQEVTRPYVSGASIPLTREAKMPVALRVSAPVTAHFANTPVDIPTAVRQISQATGITVTATPDALLPPSAFGPKTGVGSSPVLAPPMVTLRASATPMWKFLDELAAQADLRWRPTPEGAEFYRVETKTYELMTSQQVSGSSSSLGRSGSGNNAFSSDSKTSFETTGQNRLEGVKTSIEPMLSTGGKFSLSNENQTLVVTDTPQVQERVAEFVKRQNQQLQRRVRMLVESIEVVSKDGSEFGIDWNLVYNTAHMALSAGTPTSSVSAQSATGSFTQASGPFAGSGLVIKALNEVGHVLNRRVFPLVSTSGRPVTQALRTTFNYVDQVAQTAMASSTNTVTQAPTVTQKDETVGTFLTLVPTAKSDGSVFVSVHFDVTSAEPLRPYTVGSGSSAVTVQQKTINGSGMIQEVPMRSGRTEVIGGLELTTQNNTARRLADGVPMLAGGSDVATSTKSVTVLLVTPVIEEGI